MLTSAIDLSHKFGGGADAGCWALESIVAAMKEKMVSLTELDAIVESPMPGVFCVTFSIGWGGRGLLLDHYRRTLMSSTIAIILV